MSDLPGALQNNPILSTWIRFEDARSLHNQLTRDQVQDPKVIVRTGKVELGQGISTAIAMIAAEELDVDISQIVVQTGRTDLGPNEFITAGSMSIEGSGAAVRAAAAEVRGLLLARAAARFERDVDTLKVSKGVITSTVGNEAISYWELLAGKQLDVAAVGGFAPRPPAAHRLVGRSATRLDLPAKITGRPAFIQDLRPENLYHARIVRPPVLTSRLAHLDRKEIESLPGVHRVVIDGTFIGIVAATETAAISAKRRADLIVIWTEPEQQPDADMTDQARVSLLVENGLPTDDPIPDLLYADVGTRVQTTYTKPFHLHGSIGPSAALAHLADGRLTIHSHTQGPSILAAALAQALALDPKTITVIHSENAGCYGHNGADDAAMDAATLAMHCPGLPIMLKWDRSDEHRWEPFSPAARLDLDATVHDGRVVCWNADIYSYSHSGRPGPMGSWSNFIAAWHRNEPIPRPPARPGRGYHSGIHRNADPYYEFAAKRITKNLLTNQAVRTSSTRSLGAFANVFAIESFMDELAHECGVTPLDFRLRHLSDPRAIAVIQAASDALNAWQPKIAARQPAGKALAFARYKNAKTYVAIGVALTVDEQTFDVCLDHAVIAADAGQIIDRDGLSNQLEGGMVQAASWTLKEAVRFDENGIPGGDWAAYPILTFPEIPTTEIILIDHPEEPCVGAGEASHGPTPAAISNAIFDAIGVRIRDIPFLPEQLRDTAIR